MDITAENLQEHIPYYLTAPQKEGLVRALADFPRNFPYYCGGFESELLQGDGWKGFQIFNFVTGERASVMGVVLSNSCDVSTENARTLPVKITFAPLIKLSDYRRLLEKTNLTAAAIDAKIEAIRNQRVTEFFYLPAGSQLEDESVVMLGDLHSMPLREFERTATKAKSFTLSLCGFYLFLLKLSIHFCRFHEEVPRGIQA